jgi:hypothetical protein
MLLEGFCLAVIVVFGKVNLGEIGFDEHFLKPLRELYLSPIAKLLFSDCGGHNLDSHRAFTVSYGPSADCDLDLHFDNGEVTANICLSCDEDSDTVGGEVYFDGMRTDRKRTAAEQSYVGCPHRLGYGSFTPKSTASWCFTYGMRFVTAQSYNMDAQFRGTKPTVSNV